VEKPLHASLKQWYTQLGDRVEANVDGFVVDLLRDDLIIEVQTRSFSMVKSKVASLLERGHRIRIVHSIPVDRWIVKLAPDDKVISRRRSPRHAVPSDAFAELIALADWLAHPGLELDLLTTVEEEYRRFQPGVAWRRRGWTVVERRLLEVLDSRLVRDRHDLAAFLPNDLPMLFTTSDLAQRLGRPRRLAQQMTFCLRKAGIIEGIGKRGNAVEYRLVDLR
jgi:hypothetical protein